MTHNNGQTRKESIVAEISRSVGAGRIAQVASVDFSDPDRPLTCLEVDFPILSINQIAVIEGNTGKPIYQMSKWWARRRSSVFRALLLAAAMKAPDDSTQAAQAVWDLYYANHQHNPDFNRLKVADIFMGGGTTIVEGSRLGMQMYGNDLNPIAWFIVKNEMAQVDPIELRAVLNDIEAIVKPQIMPYYACDCPRGHRGQWTDKSTGNVMNADFDPVKLTPAERAELSYYGPEISYLFWAKHAPCQVTSCGHRTPIINSPVLAIKSLTIRAWSYHCVSCRQDFDVEEQAARMAPGVPLYVAETEKPYVVLDSGNTIICPFCRHQMTFIAHNSADKKQIELSLLVHPDWLAGSAKYDVDGVELGGSATDTPIANSQWYRARAERLRLLEVRGTLPEQVTCPDTKVTFYTNYLGGNSSLKVTEQGQIKLARSTFVCRACRTAQDILGAIKSSGKTGPMAAYALQGYCPDCDRAGEVYNGRFFAPVNDARIFSAATDEWFQRKEIDLKGYWPETALYHYQGSNDSKLYIQPDHGFTHFYKMFNHRQLLVNSQLLKAILTVSNGNSSVREYILGAFQQYLRNQNIYAFWNIQADKLEPQFSNNNYHPKSLPIENSLFGSYGRGNWRACVSALFETIDWARNPWELISRDDIYSRIAREIKSKSEKVYCHDPVIAQVTLDCSSSTDLKNITDGAYDLVVTDPPFGDLIHYSDLADFFYAWLSVALHKQYPDYFHAQVTPKDLEVITNRARDNGAVADRYYQDLLTQCWREAQRILKPGGMLIFTFHHSEHEPWIALLESLFQAGFWLVATYPIRSDETKGAGEFGSKTIEYDIIHVCRKRTNQPSTIGWTELKNRISQDVCQLQMLLEQQQSRLSAGDLAVIKIGKTIEYLSRHYGRIIVDDASREFSVRDALKEITEQR